MPTKRFFGTGVDLKTFNWKRDYEDPSKDDVNLMQRVLKFIDDLDIIASKT